MMKDLEIILENKPGALAALGEVLGKNNISLEGGGVFTTGDYCLAHFLVEEAARATKILAAAGISDVKINEVTIQKLRQDVPGQLGMFCRRLANANINILTQYSDHANQLIVVTDDYERANKVSAQWMEEW